MDNPFYEISETQKNKLFTLLRTHTYTFKKNEEMLQVLKHANIICILLEGKAQIIDIDYNGEETLIEKLNVNSVFGSNISRLNGSESHIIALENSKVLVIDYMQLINSNYTNHTYFNQFILNILQIITEKLKELNNRTQILTKKSIRDKLLAFFENEYKKNRSKFIYLSYNFKDLADYLSINRSAMFRELRYLKDDNFIKIDGKRITLLYTPNV